jgi:uncharacterized membrane protein YkvA (DUF1232 family)
VSAWLLLAGVVVALLALWVALVAMLVFLRPADLTAGDAARLLPDTLRLLRRLAGDRALPRGVRTRLWLVLGYLVVPFDLIPDFIPVIGYADDVIITLAVLRSVVRRAGPAALARHWTGNPEGLTALRRLAGLPHKAQVGGHPLVDASPPAVRKSAKVRGLE